jgi:predicted kinase
MHYKITLIVGLPGSGKTTLANSMMNSESFLIDDPSREEKPFVKALESGRSEIIICDPLLTITKKEVVISFLLKKFGEDIDITWIYYENDPVAAWKNHEARNKVDYRNINKEMFDHMSKKYVIPTDVITKPVYKRK